MTNTTDHRAVHTATPRLSPGQPLRIAAQTLAVIARMNALRHVAVLRTSTLPPAARPAAADRAALSGIAGHRGGMPARNGTSDVGRRLASHVTPAHSAKPLPAGAQAGAQAVGALSAGSRQAAVAAVVTLPRLAGAPGPGSPSAPTIKSAPRLTAATDGLTHHSRRLAAVAAPDAAARVRQQVAAPASSPAIAPGFHRTVRQPEAKAAVGNVYLDKTLVGYHLAAAITAEQTRAAARPNGSGASFNSSMAALRPTGAGL